MLVLNNIFQYATQLLNTPNTRHLVQCKLTASNHHYKSSVSPYLDYAMFSSYSFWDSHTHFLFSNTTLNWTWTNVCPCIYPISCSWTHRASCHEQSCHHFVQWFSQAVDVLYNAHAQLNPQDWIYRLYHPKTLGFCGASQNILFRRRYGSSEPTCHILFGSSLFSRFVVEVIAVTPLLFTIIRKIRTQILLAATISLDAPQWGKWQEHPELNRILGIWSPRHNHIYHAPIWNWHSQRDLNPQSSGS